ncbi:activating transcription factor 3 [Chrysoperla carnea]|uniref:activating transcription factor 3 n=1 Tax=Chrysoperla carnea TaxID=189513 RepID=UPI001D0789DA|nr:activating transcription factor 3 [Chrysoperla carnea]
MYNLNVNVSSSNSGSLNTTSNQLSVVNNLLAVENAANTPRTPEILNTLIALTNPLDNYDFNDTSRSTKSIQNNKISSYNPAFANDSSNSSGSQTESPTSQASVQHTCSQLIKAGLKLSIQSKRKFSGDSGGGGGGGAGVGGASNGCGSTSGGDFLDLDANNPKKRKLGSIKGEITGSEDEYDNQLISPQQGLTPEDEERRRRRRERNKIAATKCRLKKREKTVNLVQESETLETQNIELKTQIQQLETQRRRLTDMLSMHTPACVKNRNNNNNTNGTPPGGHHHYDTNSNDYLHAGGYEHQPHSDDCNSTVATIITSIPSITTLSNTNLNNPTITTYHNTTRPSSVDIPLTYSHHLDPYGDDQYTDTKPVIIVNEPGDNYSTQQLTDLDSPNTPYQYSHCHNYDTNTGQNSQGYSNSGMDNGCMA